MIERHFTLEEADPILFFGVQNANIKMLRALFPKLRIIGRDNVIKVMGSEEDMVVFEEAFTELEHRCAKFNALNEEDILDVIHHRSSGREDSGRDVIVYSTSGRPIAPRTDNQRRLVEAWQTNDMLFAVGPAGSGKTYTAIALAVRALKNKEIKKIILSRPAVEAGEKLGFLPGDMKDKIDPYLQPLYDALEEMIPPAKLQEYMQANVIQIAPLAFMRGRTFNDAFLILDEAQNTTPEQMKMFLTRLGFGSKMVITGDITQLDLPRGVSGLRDVRRVLEGLEDIEFCDLTGADVVRHSLVARIVSAYEAASAQAEAASVARKAASQAAQLECNN